MPVSSSGEAIPRVCLVCKLNLSSGMALYCHMQNDHPTEKPYWCDDCQHQFNNLKELSSHCSNIHRRRKVSCTQCFYKTTTKAKCGSMSEYTQGASSVHSVVAHSLLYLTCFIMNICMMNVLLLSAHNATWCITPLTLCIAIKLENMVKATSVRCVIDVLTPWSNACDIRKNANHFEQLFHFFVQKSFLYVTI